MIWQKIFFLVFCIILFSLLFIYLLIFCWMLLWMLTSLMISNLNITESTALKITGPWNIYVYGLLSHEMLLEKFVKPSSLPTLPASYILNVRSLRWTSDVPVKKTTLVNDGSTSNTTFWWALQTQLEWIIFEVGRTQFGSQGTELWEPYIYTWVFLFESSI